MTLCDPAASVWRATRTGEREGGEGS